MSGGTAFRKALEIANTRGPAASEALTAVLMRSQHDVPSQFFWELGRAGAPDCVLLWSAINFVDDLSDGDTQPGPHTAAHVALALLCVASETHIWPLISAFEGHLQECATEEWTLETYRLAASSTGGDQYRAYAFMLRVDEDDMYRLGTASFVVADASDLVAGDRWGALSISDRTELLAETKDSLKGLVAYSEHEPIKKTARGLLELLEQ